jgi:Tfp pilus assembly protein PilO
MAHMAISRMQAKVLGGVTALVIASLIAGSQWRGLTADLRQLAALRQQVTSAVNGNNATRDVIRHLPPFDARKRQASARLPADPNLGGMLESLNTVLSRLDLVPDELLTHATVSENRTQRLPVSLRFRGNFIQTYEVLKHLRGCERLTRVDKLTIEDDAADANPPRVEIEFSAFAGGVEALWPTK